MNNDKPIINSLLDQDFYKFTMGNVIYSSFSNTKCKFKFKNRTKNYNLAKFADALKEEIAHLCNLTFTDDEISYLQKIPFFNMGYIEFLRLLRLNRNFINIEIIDNDLSVETYGPWLHTSPFEIYVLAIIQELYTRFEVNSSELINCYKRGHQNLNEKIKLIENTNIKFADFGTRRRFNYEWHDSVIRKLVGNRNFIGTSNVHFAYKYGLKYIGTMAHEYIMAGMGLNDCQLVNCQKYMLQKWVDTYRGDLGIALSDTVGFDAFLRDFDKYFSKLYDGCRHDSGDPYIWCSNLISHYEQMGVNPKTKSAVFSDGLNFKIMLELYKTFDDRINTSFGIGTNLTNDVGVEPLQLVMKMIECNGNPVAKVSDSKGKGMCEDAEFLNYLKKVFLIRN